MAQQLQRTLTLCLVLGLTSMALAQQERPPEIAGPARLLFVPDVKKELKLSDEQVGKLKDVLGKVMTKYKEIFEKFQKSPPSQEEAEKTIKAFHDDSWKAIKGVLDTKQMTRFQQILWQQGRVGALQDPDLQKELKLSDEQKKKLDGMFKDAGKQIRELSKNRGVSREEMQKKSDAVEKELDAKVNGVLTDEQKKKLKELKGPKFEFSRPAPAPQPKKD
ncbi:MAG TPA: hypothetical protein VMG10_01345 [Gemmataceae bacterium]|nr:hypothetical protein [Gemmataceae bacterium]